MPQKSAAQQSLAQRVNSYLRTENPSKKVFAVKETAAELLPEEYLLERAEAELRIAQTRVEKLKRRLAKRKAAAE